MVLLLMVFVITNDVIETFQPYRREPEKAAGSSASCEVALD